MSLALSGSPFLLQLELNSRNVEAGVGEFEGMGSNNSSKDGFVQHLMSRGVSSKTITQYELMIKIHAVGQGLLLYDVPLTCKISEKRLPSTQIPEFRENHH